MWQLKDGIYSDDEFPFFNLVTTKISGDMKDAAARAKLCSLNGVDPGGLVCAEQVHGSFVAVAGKKDGGMFIKGADGLVSAEKGTALAIFTADCVPVFLGAKGKACSIVHAGWRGLYKKIIPEAVKLLSVQFGVSPREIAALIGPHICPKCYAIGPEIREAFGLSATDEYFDLGREAVRQLNNAGVTSVTTGAFCTLHDKDMLFSYRKDKTSSRIMSLVKI